MRSQYSYFWFFRAKVIGKVKPVRIKISLIILFTVLFMDCSMAQGNSTVHTFLSPNSIILGQQAEFTVELSLPREMGLNGWFNYPDTFNHLEILSRQKIDTVSQRDNVLYRQKMVITGFDSGRWVIPSLVVQAGNKKIKTDTLSIFVMPVALRDTGYHDIKEIISVPAIKTPWWYYALGLVTAIVLIAAAIYFFKKRKPVVPLKKEEQYKMSPYDQARHSLKNLKGEQLPAKGELKKYYSQLQDILRLYLLRRYSVRAMQETTSELLVQLKGIGMSEEPLSQLAEVLRIGDAVKFAKYLPDGELQESSFDLVSAAIEGLEKIKVTNA